MDGEPNLNAACDRLRGEAGDSEPIFRRHYDPACPRAPKSGVKLHIFWRRHAWYRAPLFCLWPRIVRTRRAWLASWLGLVVVRIRRESP